MEYNSNQNKNSKLKINTAFGPQLQKIKPINSVKNVRKLIHYDCGENNKEDEEIPNEDEIYIKENLLKVKKDDKDNLSE
jgi:hypothetical protein